MIAGDELIAALPRAELHHWRPLAVQSIVSDSRRVAPGDLFVAVPGVAVDGHGFVAAALAAGAVACVVERLLPELEGVPTAVVPDAREALGWLYAAWYGYPSRRLRLIGITGTDGKTTTTRLATAMLRAGGHHVGAIDSVAAVIGDEELPTGFHTTTPDAPDIQHYLAEMAARGADYAVIETTSHGLAQQRVAGCEYDVAVVTNITHEHLDYHGTYTAYREAKAMLFRGLSAGTHKPGVPKVAVLNVDDSSYAYLSAIPAERRITYGLAGEAQVTARDVAVSPAGLHFTACTPEFEIALDSPLVGRFNVANILAAAGVAWSQGVLPEAIRAAVAGVHGVRGRMERIDQGQPFTVIVDFAHTPNALENALQTARDLAEGRRVLVVFGCAGLRDRAKRPMMGEVAGRLADHTIITAEDPRTESLAEISEEIAKGCRQAGQAEGQGYRKVPDRGEAIRAALAMARPGDVVIVTGKGHEESMCFGTTEYPWSDHQAVADALGELGYG